MYFWSKIVGLLLRNRISILLAIGVITVFFGFHARNVEMIYEFPDLLPSNNPTKQAYQNFQEKFGESSAVLVIGTDKNPLYNLYDFNNWKKLEESISKVEGVDTVISISNLFQLKKNTADKKFELTPIISKPPTTQAELDSLREITLSLPFYKGLLYNDTTGACLMAVNLDRETFNSKKREKLVNSIQVQIEEFQTNSDLKVYVSGLAYIRTVITNMIKGEIVTLLLLAVLVTVLILALFFKSIEIVFSSLLVVCLCVVWYFGLLSLLNFKITVLTALIPPLIIVIGVPNCIFLVNKFHTEFKLHGNKVRALSRVIEKIGNATLLTNATTASGFLTFVFTQNPLLIEFGIVASISIMFIFVVAICIIPILLSYFSDPNTKHIQHLDKKWIVGVVGSLETIVKYKRKAVYITTLVLIVIGLYGVSLLEITGNVVDDVPSEHTLVTDLKFFEKHFNGVLPFEISIDAKKPQYATKDHTLKKIEKLYKVLDEYPEISRPLSVIDGIKFIKQSYYNGNEKKYSLINRQEKAFFKPYLEGATSNKNWLNAFVDSTKQFTRVSASMADIGTKEMDALFADLNPKIDSIFNPEKYNIKIVGSSIIFLKGTTFLVDNLKTSLAIAILIISVIMWLLFRSWKMVIVSLIPNLIPLLLTAAIMGFFKVGIKPSTILVFSIAFGISVDDTIHFLAKYRQELKQRKWNIGESVYAALRETGVSMIYTSIILFFGFSLFMSSTFGGTKALGILISMTLLVAMLSNLVLLPCFLISLERFLTTKAFKEPLLEIIEEEEDIDLNKLKVDNPTYLYRVEESAYKDD